MRGPIPVCQPPRGVEGPKTEPKLSVGSSWGRALGAGQCLVRLTASQMRCGGSPPHPGPLSSQLWAKCEHPGLGEPRSLPSLFTGAGSRPQGRLGNLVSFQPPDWPGPRHMVAELGPHEDVKLQRRSAWKSGQMPLSWQDDVPEGRLATAPGEEQQDSQGGA